MWPEPLLAGSEDIASHTVAVTVRDGAGVPIAAVLCAHNAAAGFGVFGEMRILDSSGAPRQRSRALVLLVREALRYADAAGITRVRTEAPDGMQPFAVRMSGIDGRRLGRKWVFEGELHAVRTAALAASRDDGSFREGPGNREQAPGEG
jgi:hypothetical protein